VSPVEYAGVKHSLQAYIAVCFQIHCNPSSLVIVINPAYSTGTKTIMKRMITHLNSTMDIMKGELTSDESRRS